MTPGLSGVTAKPLSDPPRLREEESSTSVIVIEWGESPTNIAQPILYEVDFTLTPFGESARDPVKEFVSFDPPVRIIIQYVHVYTYAHVHVCVHTRNAPCTIQTLPSSL